MDPGPIISEICDQADDSLAGLRKRDEVRSGIAEWLATNHAKLPPPDKKTVIAPVGRIPGNEGLLERAAGGAD